MESYLLSDRGCGAATPCAQSCRSDHPGQHNTLVMEGAWLGGRILARGRSLASHPCSLSSTHHRLIPLEPPTLCSTLQVPVRGATSQDDLPVGKLRKLGAPA